MSKNQKVSLVSNRIFKQEETEPKICSVCKKEIKKPKTKYCSVGCYSLGKKTYWYNVARQYGVTEKKVDICFRKKMKKNSG